MASPDSDLIVQLEAPNGVCYAQPVGLFINNEFVAAVSSETITTINPANEQEIISVHSAGVEDVDNAVHAARVAFHGPWRKFSPAARGRLLLCLAGLVEAHKEVLATIETWDNGKPYHESLEFGVCEVVDVLTYYAGYADKQPGQVIGVSDNQHVYTLQEPIGVCGQIIPWNFPLNMAAWKLAPALAAGNCVVLKAAEQTPLSVLYLASLIREAGFPPGVVNVINGLGKTAGAALTGHPDVDKVAFTGSTDTGKQIMRLASNTLKKISLETGGKSPMIIFPDADLYKAAYWAHLGIMSDAGQNCTANSRILVHELVHDAFLKIFLQQIRSAPLGDPFSPHTFQGPLISKAQHDRVLDYIEIGLSEGASLATGGRTWNQRPNQKGYFVEPTLFTDVHDDMRICREEIFGPVAVMMKFSSENEAVARANDSIFGLGAALFTKDVSRIHRVVKKIESGTVWVNCSNNMDIRVPFGGVKQSGIGRELGDAGIKAYSSIKSVYIELEDEDSEKASVQHVNRDSHL
ncbi:aldehyde dehydrogenase domain-containing protein [Ilyonectria robusta]|uniref:aldehyde dehydrogenase domain-containing protein n=1 Tax=Ilyonectria robusta TaxID=1079257 RepID=UPI001E8CB4EE|nr:aldehyde dehydrogenase domain-containing protein [Ilyonectria robusta]KAH8673207.1 aldehyde dehydrogenase domain-containing protein [Ilyonectria robusta]